MSHKFKEVNRDLLKIVNPKFVPVYNVNYLYR